MKKHSLLMLLPFSLIVAGCSVGGKGNIFNEKFMKRNFGCVIKYTHEYATPELLELNFEEGVTPQETDQYDLFKVSKDGVVGFYNVLNNSYPLPLSVGITDDLLVTKATTGGAFLDPEVELRVLSGTKTVDDKKVLLVFDDYGNKLYEGENGALTTSAEAIARKAVEKQERTELQVKVNGLIKAVAYYNVDGSFKEVIDGEEYYKRNPHIQFGYSLVEYGHKELKYNLVDPDDHLSGDSRRFTVFNTKKDKYVTSFDIPANAYYTLIGNKVIYQVKDTLPDRAEKYDYSEGETKYSLRTYSVNYQNGKTQTIKTNFVLSETDAEYELLNKNGVKNLNLFVQVKEIGKDKVLSPIERDLILNENLKELADVTGTGFIDLEEFGEKYYQNPNTGIIYDSKLKEVGKIRGDLTETAPLVKSGRYGLINHKGEFIESPVYTSAYQTCVEGHYVLQGEKSFKIVKINEKEQIEVVKELSKDDYTYGTIYLNSLIVIRKSDSKSLMIDIASGQETATPDVPEGSTYKYGEEVSSLASTIDAMIFAYEKDGKFFVIRLMDKQTIEYSFKK